MKASKYLAKGRVDGLTYRVYPSTKDKNPEDAYREASEDLPCAFCGELIAKGESMFSGVMSNDARCYAKARFHLDVAGRDCWGRFKAECEERPEVAREVFERAAGPTYSRERAHQARDARREKGRAKRKTRKSEQLTPEQIDRLASLEAELVRISAVLDRLLAERGIAA